MDILQSYILKYSRTNEAICMRYSAREAVTEEKRCWNAPYDGYWHSRA